LYDRKSSGAGWRIPINQLFIFNLQERNFMKNIMTLAVFVAFLTMALPSGAMAQCCKMGGGPMRCAAVAAATVTPETLQKFNKETKALREQLIDKQALLKKEWLKDDPDPETIATIRKAIIDIQMEMQKVAKKLGIKNGFGSCPMLQGNCCGGGCQGGMPMLGR
jgi:hypothetical protein